MFLDQGQDAIEFFLGDYLVEGLLVVEGEFWEGETVVSCCVDETVDAEEGLDALGP